MGKPRLESVEEVMGEGPTWDRKQLDEMEPEFREELEEAFRLFDREGDGQIETQELSNLLWSLGLQPSREEVEDLLVEMDADRSETVDIDEFLLAMARIMREKREKDESGEVFASIDKDRDGMICRGDLTKILVSLGQQGTDQQVSAMMTAAAGEDAKVSLLDFQNVTKSLFGKPQ